VTFTGIEMVLIREQRYGVWVIHVEGPLRVPINGELWRSVDTLLRHGAERILVNLAAVRDLDAGGVGELVRVYTMAMGSDADLRVAEATPWARELLRLAGLLEPLSAGSNEWWPKAV
jgi:hypothetical protein